MLDVTVSSGDITRVSCDGLITAINGGGMWFGGIDGAIQRSAGNMFHAQAAERMPLTDGDVVYAPASDGHRVVFGSVIFVIDELQKPLREVVLAGLQEAEKRQLGVVTLPLLRTGVMAGAYEKTVEAALDETAVAIKQFMASKPQYVRELRVIVFNDAPSVSYLNDALK
jgi:O-acetyl-ADP-ribose deacetylase (regulator of RNase III)